MADGLTLPRFNIPKDRESSTIKHKQHTTSSGVDTLPSFKVQTKLKQAPTVRISKKKRIVLPKDGQSTSTIYRMRGNSKKEKFNFGQGHGEGELGTIVGQLSTLEKTDKEYLGSYTSQLDNQLKMSSGEVNLNSSHKKSKSRMNQNLSYNDIKNMYKNSQVNGGSRKRKSRVAEMKNELLNTNTLIIDENQSTVEGTHRKRHQVMSVIPSGQLNRYVHMKKTRMVSVSPQYSVDRSRDYDKGIKNIMKRKKNYSVVRQLNQSVEPTIRLTNQESELDHPSTITTQEQQMKINTSNILESVTPLALMNQKQSVLISTSMLSGIDSTTNETTMIDKKMSKEMINNSFLYQPLDKKSRLNESSYGLPQLTASPALMSIENMLDVSVSEMSNERQGQEGERTGTFNNKRKSQDEQQDFRVADDFEDASSSFRKLKKSVDLSRKVSFGKQQMQDMGSPKINLVDEPLQADSTLSLIKKVKPNGEVMKSSHTNSSISHIAPKLSSKYDHINSQLQSNLLKDPVKKSCIIQNVIQRKGASKLAQSSLQPTTMRAPRSLEKSTNRIKSTMDRKGKVKSKDLAKLKRKSRFNQDLIEHLNTDIKRKSVIAKKGNKSQLPKFKNLKSQSPQRLKKLKKTLGKSTFESAMDEINSSLNQNNNNTKRLRLSDMSPTTRFHAQQTLQNGLTKFRKVVRKICFASKFMNATVGKIKTELKIDKNKQMYYDSMVKLFQTARHGVRSKNKSLFLECQVEIIRSAIKIPDETVLKASYMITGLYSEYVKDFSNSEFCYNKFRDLSEEMANHKSVMNGLKLLGNMYQQQKQFKRALKTYQTMLKFAYVSDNVEGEMEAYDKIALQYYYLGNLKKGHFYHQRYLLGQSESTNSAIKDLFKNKYKDHEPSILFSQLNQPKTNIEDGIKHRFHDLTRDYGKVGEYLAGNKEYINMLYKTNQNQSQQFKGKEIKLELFEYDEDLKFRQGIPVDELTQDDLPSPGGHGHNPLKGGPKLEDFDLLDSGKKEMQQSPRLSCMNQSRNIRIIGSTGNHSFTVKQFEKLKVRSRKNSADSQPAKKPPAPELTGSKLQNQSFEESDHENEEAPQRRKKKVSKHQINFLQQQRQKKDDQVIRAKNLGKESLQQKAQRIMQGRSTTIDGKNTGQEHFMMNHLSKDRGNKLQQIDNEQTKYDRITRKLDKIIQHCIGQRNNIYVMKEIRERQTNKFTTIQYIDEDRYNEIYEGGLSNIKRFLNTFKYGRTML